MSEQNSKIGEKLHYLREHIVNSDTGLPYNGSEIYVATNREVSYASWYAYLDGKLPSTPKLIALAKLFGVTTDYLLNDDIPVELDLATYHQTANLLRFRAPNASESDINEAVRNLYHDFVKEDE